jgi:hypothetical protein
LGEILGLIIRKRLKKAAAAGGGGGAILPQLRDYKLHLFAITSTFLGSSRTLGVVSRLA